MSALIGKQAFDALGIQKRKAAPTAVGEKAGTRPPTATIAAPLDGGRPLHHFRTSLAVARA
jgi:hypothetical protein